MNEQSLIPLKLFTVILFSFVCTSCEKQIRVSFDMNTMTLQTCDASIIKEMSIYCTDGVGCPIYRIWLKDHKKGDNKISLKEFHRDYYYPYDRLDLKKNSIYKVVVDRGHTNATVLLYIGSTGEVSHIENKEPCL